MAMEGYGSNIQEDVQEVMRTFFPDEQRKRMNSIRTFV
jgi:hypothetical protein